ncbi:PIR protein [Plasmodium ovale]|uniref:PIR protein n=2 Tax=Plasmodium ovale TaxID=36330 RepID=A0A1C3KN04_PLAOA|nr:PIR protein [Plasmodium ovale]
MTEIMEENQIPKMFYRELNNKADISTLEKLPIYTVIKMLEPGPAAKVILAKSHRNIELIRTKYSDSATKRCRDINYWFDKETETRESQHEYKNVSDCAFALFNSIKWNKQNNDIICKRQKSIHTTDERELRKILDDFCEIRNNLRCTMLEGFNECLMYNNYIQKKKVDFFGKKNVCKDNSCKIDEKCTLADMDITFPSINCHELHNVQKLDQKEPLTTKYSSLEIGFFLIVSFLTFFLISLFLYKMTPFGSLLRNYLSRKNIIKEKMNEKEYDELFQYSFHSEPPYSGCREYDLDYRSLPN